jgi:hypothetical protein
MKTIQIFSLILALLVVQISSAVESLDQYPREIKKSFNVNKDVLFQCDADFADINVTTWDKSTIEIVVTVTINAKTEERANELFERITIEMEGGGAQVDLKMTVEDMKTKNNENWSMKANVNMPAGGSVKGDVDFGDFIVNNLSGYCSMNVQYGDFKIGNLESKNNEVYVAFGNVSVGTWGGGKCNVQYGDSKFNDVKGNMELKVQFGDADIESLNSACKIFDAEVEYGDLDIRLGSGFGGSFDANSSYGDVDLPANAVIGSKEKDFTSTHKTGTIGSGSSKVKVEVSFGDVEIE